MKQKLFKALFVCMAVAFLPQVTHAAGDIEINATNFPDDNFRNYLLEQEYGKDGKLTEDEIKDVEKMYVGYRDIHSLQGIEYFTALTELYCVATPLTALDVSKNTALTELRCEGNQLATLDVSKNTALTELHCSWNQLKTLDVSKNTALIELGCANNRLAALDVSKNTALTNLSCSGNQLTDLDVSKNTSLTELRCDNNQLTALDVSGCTALEILFCSNNQLTALYVSKNKLTILDCRSNKLTSLDVSGCTTLKELACDDNQLTNLNVSKNTSLDYLYCYNNQIKGTSMDNFIKSLPTVSYCPLYVYSSVSSSEGNVCTKEQVLAAREKGWIAYYERDGYVWEEYEGSDETPSNVNDIRTEVGKDVPVYNLRGQRLMAPQKGVNIIGGRKVVVR